MVLILATSVISYLAINWVLFTSVGIVFNMAYRNINPTVKYFLAACFVIFGLFKIVFGEDEDGGQANGGGGSSMFRRSSTSGNFN